MTAPTPEWSARLTQRQAEFLTRLLQGTVDSTEDLTVARDCRHILKRLARAGQKERERGCGHLPPMGLEKKKR